MSIGSLITFFSMFTKLPVYAEDVRDQIVELGVQDEISFVPLNVPPERLLGMFVRSRKRQPPYSEHANISTIFYNINVPPDEQNFICCKELMHVFDEKVSPGVKTGESLNKLLDDLFRNRGQKSEEYSISGFLDLTATYMAAAVMFPHEIWPDFMAAHSAGRMTEDDISKELGLPLAFVPQLLNPQWEMVRNLFLRL
jgi:hypothetical protein